ncbi:transcriptional regulator [Cutibacterium acnes JCM 18920]|nr:transcriptional regulator [Cutibacterium acnes JCM 18920]
MFGVNTTVVPVKSGTTEIHRLDQVARIAGQMVTDIVEDNSAVGIAWGTTLDAVTHYVVPKDVKGVSVVQMNGSANPASSGIPYVDRSCQEWLLHLVARLSISRSQPSSTVRQQRPQCGKNVPFRPSLKHIESSILLFLASEPLTARSPPTSIQRVT